MTPFKPITREVAADILSVSLSTLDQMIVSESIPPPRTLGGRRQYWHPAIFYAWLDQKLRDEPTTQAEACPATRRRVIRSPSPSGVAERARTRDAARLKQLNE